MVGRTLDWARRHPRAVDTASALAVFVYTLPQAMPGTPAAVGVLPAVGLCAPIALRRSRPLGTSSVVVLAFLLQLAMGVGPLAADVALLVVVYTVAARCRLRSSLPLTLLACGCWVLAWVRWDLPYLTAVDLGYALVLTGVAGLLGRLVRDRGARLRREREQQARIVAAAERARIARDIHDVVSHGLSAVVVLAAGAAANVQRDPARAADAMRRVEATGRSALTEMRRMLDVLRDTGPGSRPGVAQVEQLVADAKAAGSPARLTVEGAPRPLPSAVDLAVYRIVQEGLTNSRRHAGPGVSRVDVVLSFGEDDVEVTVRDDGAGPVTGAGHGLTGMHERVVACGGELRAGPGSTAGFVVSARMPAGRDS